MTDFNDRQRGEEAKFAFDGENAFKLAARRNRLLGQWAAGKLGLTPEEADSYAKSVVQADFEEAGDDDVVRKVANDLAVAGSSISEADVRSALAQCEAEARRQLSANG